MRSILQFAMLSRTFSAKVMPSPGRAAEAVMGAGFGAESLLGWSNTVNPIAKSPGR